MGVLQSRSLTILLCMSIWASTVQSKPISGSDQLIKRSVGSENGVVLQRLNQAIENAWKMKGFSDDLQLLSRRLNTLFGELSQFICELNDHITNTGSWCMSDFKNLHAFDEFLATAMSQVLKGQQVVSLGEGPGLYRSAVLASDLVTTYDAYDGSPMIEKATAGNVSYLDLSIPQYGLPLYDWAVSLEVAEHIPREYEDIFLNNVVRHAKRGIILSWAPVGQAGKGHVNCRPDEYVESKMKSLGFYRDSNLSHVLRKAASLWWLRKNVHVYVRGEKSTETASVETETAVVKMTVANLKTETAAVKVVTEVVKAETQAVRTDTAAIAAMNLNPNAVVDKNFVNKLFTGNVFLLIVICQCGIHCVSSVF